MTKLTTNRAVGLVTAFAVLATSAVPLGASAATSTSSIEATVASVISVTSATSVSISVLPAGGAKMSSISDSVTVDTNDTKGYSLTLNNSDTSTALDNGAAGLIPAHAGTPASPSDLAVNTWGFRVDGLGAFGTGTTTETNVSTSAFTWAGIPASTSPQQIKSTTAAGTGSATTVWYGVKADGTNPDGSYIDTVTYTATVNP